MPTRRLDVTTPADIRAHLLALAGQRPHIRSTELPVDSPDIELRTLARVIAWLDEPIEPSTAEMEV